MRVGGWFIGTVIGWVCRLWRVVGSAVRQRLTPSYRFRTRDPQLEGMARVQAVLGVLITTAAFLTYGDVDLDAASAELDRVLTGSVATAGIGAAAVVLAALLLILLAPSGSRLLTARHLTVPVRLVVGSFAVIGLAFSAIAVGPTLLDTDSTGVGGVVLAIVVVLALIAVIVALLAALVAAVPLIITHYFRAVDGHPALRPIVGIVVATWSLTSGIIDIAQRGTDPRYPLLLGLALLGGGSFALITLAGIELSRLRSRYAITVRSVMPDLSPQPTATAEWR